MIDARRVVELQQQAVDRWHRVKIDQPFEGVLGLICAQHAYNFRLWHEEDKARDPRATDGQIADVKRAIDRLNQHRNDWVEKIDEWIIGDLRARRVAVATNARRATETPGSAIDRLSILCLRQYHLAEQLERHTSDAALQQSLETKLMIAARQLADLSAALAELLAEIYAGRARHDPYRQLKMYNDPDLNPYLSEHRALKAG